MKKLSILTVILFSVLSMKAQSIAGTWKLGKSSTKIEIKDVNGVYEGNIASSEHAKMKIGTPMLKEVKSAADGKWTGKFFAPKKGKWMDAMLQEKGDNQLLVKIDAGRKSREIQLTRE